MKRINRRLIIISILLMVIGIIDIQGAERPIYVGDLVHLQVEDTYVSEGDIREAFSEFEIVELSLDNNLYNLIIRSFEIGEHRVLLGDQTILLTVDTTLDKETRETVYMGSSTLAEPDMNIYIKYLLYIGLIITLISLISVIIKKLRNKKLVNLSPLEKLELSINELTIVDSDYVMLLVQYFKEFLEEKFETSFLDKTSRELCTLLKVNENMNDTIPVIETWLNKCDSYKYTNNACTTEVKDELKSTLLQIASGID